MIQRIQSIYLLASAILLFICLSVPIATFTSLDNTIELTAFIIKDSTQTTTVLSLGISIWITAIFSIATIFMYKKRKLQMRFVRYTVILKVALIAFMAYFIYQISHMEQAHFTPKLGLLLIVIALVTDWLAYKGIKHDDDLVRSVDRIR